MGAQQAIFAAAEPELLELTADLERPEPLCQLVAEVGGDRPDTGPAFELSDDAIRQRSQQIWESEGCPEGYAQDHWERARAELAALMARTSNTQHTVPQRPENDVPPLRAADIELPEAPPAMASAAVLEVPCEIRDDDVAREPEAVLRQDLAVSPPRDEVVSAAPRPLRPVPATRLQQAGVVPSIICAGLVFRGTLESSGDIQFDGNMEGDICCAGLAIGDDAFIQGDVVADSVFVRGRIQGRIRARRVYLACGSFVEGVIYYGTLAVEGGAQIDGSFQCLEDPQELEFAAEPTDVLPQHALSTATTETDCAA